jgi:sodium transport system permease protein
MAIALALLVHPVGLQFTSWVHQLYPLSSEVIAQMEEVSKALSAAPFWWIPIMLVALLPALCEEIAFRGFILSGFRHVGHKWWAILGSSIVFGAVHPVLQQKISAAAIGIFLGILAVQTASLVPCILFHAIYNGLGMMTGYLATIHEDGRPHPIVQALIHTDGKSFSYQPWFVALCAVGTALILWGLHRRPYERTDEEQLEEKRQHQGLL